MIDRSAHEGFTESAPRSLCRNRSASSMFSLHNPPAAFWMNVRRSSAQVTRRFPVDVAQPFWVRDHYLPRNGQTKTIQTAMGAKGDNRFNASATADVSGLGGKNRVHDGAKERVAQGCRIWHPDDSVLHQPGGETFERDAPARARTSEADPAAPTQASGQAFVTHPGAIGSSEVAARQVSVELPDRPATRFVGHRTAVRCAGVPNGNCRPASSPRPCSRDSYKEASDRPG